MNNHQNCLKCIYDKLKMPCNLKNKVIKENLECFFYIESKNNINLNLLKEKII